MVKGVGVDILKISELLTASLDQSDPFFRNTYAKEEYEEGRKREVPYYYYATRFAGKEAVFKCFGIPSDKIRLNEIRILDDENGQPHVTLTGSLADIAREKDITEILISLSYDKEYAMAFAIAQ